MEPAVIFFSKLRVEPVIMFAKLKVELAVNFAKLRMESVVISVKLRVEPAVNFAKLRLEQKNHILDILADSYISVPTTRGIKGFQEREQVTQA